MNSRFAALAACFWLTSTPANAQSSTGHSVSRQTSDSTASGLPMVTPISGGYTDTSRPPPYAAPIPEKTAWHPAGSVSPAPKQVSDTAGAKGHWRAGLHASAHDVGLLLGVSVRAKPVSLGLDAWVRPGIYTKEVRTTPTRRAQYKELLWGMDPWVQAEFGSELRLAVAASLDVAVGTWYGTDKSPEPDVQPALGLKLLFPAIFQIGIRGTYGEGLLGRLRGDVVCEF